MEKVVVNRVPMTSEGRAKLETEINNLSQERPVLIDAIAAARSQGDLSENAEYHAARERQSFVEGRIQELESLRSRCEVVDVSRLSGDSVMFGATVNLLVIDDSGNHESLYYKIVSEYEADVSKLRLSITSPLASALIGKKRGEYAEVRTPKGERLYQIVSVEFK